MVNISIDNATQGRDDGIMYGKHFASMYIGSMYGKSALVFAVWGYVISHFRQSKKDGQCYVELNPALLGGIFSTSPTEVLEALEVLESPDPVSRSKALEGRRLVLLDENRGIGPLHYHVVNGAKYKAIRDEEDRREYLKEAQRLSRARKKKAEDIVNNVNHGQPPSTHAEGDADAGSERSDESDIERVIGHLNAKTGFHYRANSEATTRLLGARLRESTVDECLAVIDAKVDEWLGTKWNYCLRPKTLFNATNFENYLGALGSSPPDAAPPSLPPAPESWGRRG